MSRAYTLQDLRTFSLSELFELRGRLQRQLASCPQGSPACRDALLSLQAVATMIRLRAPHPSLR